MVPRVPFLDERVYNHETFLAAFDKDLAAAKTCVFLQSAFLTEEGFERTIDRAAGLIARGVRVCIFLKPPVAWRFRKSAPRNARETKLREKCAEFERCINAFKAAGVHVNLRMIIHEKVSIVDGIVFWDGSLNILSFEEGCSRERMTRHLDPFLLADAVYRHGFNECEDCMRQQEQKPAPVDLVVDTKTFGTSIKMRRKLLRLSLKDLGDLVGIDSGTLGAIERGERVPRLDTAVKIANALQCHLAWVTTPGLPVLEQIVTALPPPTA